MTYVVEVYSKNKEVFVNITELLRKNVSVSIFICCIINLINKGENLMDNKKGATQHTPSYSQYFSWINNTNEGSTEEQTLINLDYFKWLNEKYGMKLDIYAWDAGNLDGSRSGYAKLDDPKIKAQYPDGYVNVVKAAAEMGTRFGLWCGPDGFGTTSEDAQARKELMISLCRDLNFNLFKLDGVCGQLRQENRTKFVEMVNECRKYSPDLIILNHRLNLGQGNDYVTTELWKGGETYVDIFACNDRTAPHHRAFLFTRGLTDNLDRLMEDHGVCISSCVDFFEDELIYQAFSRCLILAPETYGNPWLMNDEEQGHYAHIYNLHRRLKNILTDGFVLPQEIYGINAVSRGSDDVRVLCFGNNTWETKTVTITLNEEIGLKPCDKVKVISHHPFESVMGTYNYSDKITVEVNAFRAALYEICDIAKAPDMPENCEYIVLHEDEHGRPDKIKIVKNDEFDNKFYKIKKIGTATECAVLKNVEKYYESAMFAIDNDSLESRSLRRSGQTKYEAVRKARDAFFNQATFKLRGCDQKYAFDGNEDTFFDGRSYEPPVEHRKINGGCLRVDFGDVFDVDFVEIEYFDTDENLYEVCKQHVPEKFEYSKDLEIWENGNLFEIKVVNDNETMNYVRDCVHDILSVKGRRCISVYGIHGKARYMRMAEPVNRIYRISAIKDGKRIALSSPKLSNLMSHYNKMDIVGMKKLEFILDESMWIDGCYISVACEGTHGTEGVYAVAECENTIYGAEDRALSYPSNSFECRPTTNDSYYTYYIKLPKSATGKKVTVWAMLTDSEHTDFEIDCYICPPNREPDGIVIER